MKNIILSLFVSMLGFLAAVVVAANYTTEGQSSGSEVMLGWDTPTEKVDGSTLLENEISGYNIYEEGALAFQLERVNEMLYDNEGFGRTCFSISTVDVWGQEGPQSEPYCHTFTPAAPGSPTLRAKIN